MKMCLIGQDMGFSHCLMDLPENYIPYIPSTDRIGVGSKIHDHSNDNKLKRKKTFKKSTEANYYI